MCYFDTMEVGQILVPVCLGVALSCGLERLAVASSALAADEDAFHVPLKHISGREVQSRGIERPGAGRVLWPFASGPWHRAL